MLRSVRQGLVCGLGLLGLWSVAAVEAQQPTLVVSIRGIDELLDTADLISDAAGQPGVKGRAEDALNNFTGGAGLKGIDRKKSLGIYSNVTPDGQPQMPVLFIPISDPKAFKALIKSLTIDFTEQDGLMQSSAVGTPLYGKITDGYCFISPSPDLVAKPAVPNKISNPKYVVAIDAVIGQIPQPLKDQFLATMDQQIQNQLEQDLQNGTEAEKRGKRLGVELVASLFRMLVNESDRLTVGYDVAAKSRLLTVDASVSGKSGTEMAKSLSAYGKMTPLYANVLSATSPFQLVASYPTGGETGAFGALAKLAGEEALNGVDMDKNLKSDEERAKVKDFLQRLFGLTADTIKSGSSHSVVVLEPGLNGLVRAVAGTKLASGKDADKLFDDGLKMVQGSPQAAKVRADVAKHAGARIHQFDPGFKDEQRVFGEGPGHLAIGADSAWVTVGDRNLDVLKSTLDKSGKKPEKSPASISLRAKPATLITLLEKDNQGLIARAAKISGKTGDVLNVDVLPVNSGATLHVELGLDLFSLSEK